MEMVYCPDGPDVDAEQAKELRSLAYGSAFIFELEGQQFLVTARHNVTGRHWQTGEFLGGYSMAPTHIVLHLLAKPPAGGWQIGPSEVGPHVGSTQIKLKAFLVPLLGDDWKPRWMEHPTFGADMDVVVLPVKFTDDDTLVIPWTTPLVEAREPHEAPWPNLAAGQEVFVVGYPDALITGPMFPLWTRGSIASEPYFGYTVADKRLPLMLIDARTRQGQSGSAVMRHRPEGTVVTRSDGALGVTTGPVSQLIGVYSGRTSDESDLGFVWRMDEVEVVCRNGVQGTS
ncbi:hypothetical protein C6A86_009110 [Mycobacterium sp. ITM-2016-00316]|uniref:hypothetical protein n=1 Tax=Mycobacterium sp. ITM-2016-00316 TaxID=2099695 RepID=UPI000CF8CBFD|nr:hypothetical protein [Mycobacterium sp. ITM-2016-00316]WNG83790.1 hypothetical protein C6A86_009110 [Mycobacterium sp. ITM-2016-00316]